MEKVEARYKFHSKFMIIYYILIAGMLIQKYIFKNNLLFDVLAFLACYNTFCYGGFVLTGNKTTSRIIGTILGTIVWGVIMYAWTQVI